MSRTITLFIVILFIRMNDSVAQSLGNVLMNSENKWILFDDSEDAMLRSEFDMKNALLLLGQTEISPNDTWQLVSQGEPNEDGILRDVYQQYFNNLPIEGAQYYVLFVNNKLKAMSGKFVVNLSFQSSIPQITESLAFNNALISTNASEYAWDPVVINSDTYYPMEDTIIIDEILEDTWVIEDSLGNQIILDDTIYKNIIVRVIPSGRLCYTQTNAGNEMTPLTMKLAYQFTVTAREPYMSKNIYVDALNGDIIKAIDLSDDGTVSTLYNGSKSFVTKWTGSAPWKRYILQDDSRGIRTYEHDIGNDVHDYNDDWTTDVDRKHATAHWATQVTWQYFLDKQGLNGINGGGLGVTVVSKANNNLFSTGSNNNCNAQWNRDSDLLLTGDKGGNLCNSFPTSLDVIAHEYTHGIADYRFGGFNNSLLHSRAINESFSDIFGCAVEYYALGSTDWIMFHDWLDDWDYKRKLDDPNYSGGINQTSGCPSYYEQPGYWSFTTTNSGYGHINAGVQNHWFYLLANGGPAPAGSPNSDIVVNGIGIEKAARISFYNLFYFMQPSSNYFDSRNGSILSAIILYGICSPEVEQTINAWDAVGVSGGFGANLDVVTICSQIPAVNPYFALRNLESSCDISPVSTLVSFKAGTKISLLPGFKSNSNFSASIDPCLSYATKSLQTDSSQTEQQTTNFNFDANKTKPSSVPIIFVQPNPTSDVVRILSRSSTDKLETLCIYNSCGQKIMDLSPEIVNQVNLSNYGSGLYIIIARTLSNMAIEKLIVE